MNFEQELKRVSDQYTGQGYRVVTHPNPEDLPPFAKDFKVEIIGKRGDDGVLVAVKKNRDELSLDPFLPLYAERTGMQTGWRFDFVVLEGEDPTEPRGREAREFSVDDVDKTMEDAAQMARLGFVRAAVLTAWGALEAAMRIRLRAAHIDVRGDTPRVMANELYSSGMVSADEFHELQRMYRLRNEIVHGFSSPSPGSEAVSFLSNLADRLLADSQQTTALPV